MLALTPDVSTKPSESDGVSEPNAGDGWCVKVKAVKSIYKKKTKVRVPTLKHAVVVPGVLGDDSAPVSAEFLAIGD